MFMEYIHRMWTGNGVWHILRTFKSGPSEGSCSYLLRGWKAEYRRQNLQCSPNTYKLDKVNHSDIL